MGECMTATAVYRRCRNAGIVLAAEGGAIVFDAPPGVVVPVDEIRLVKPELLAVLVGDYLDAAAAALLRSIPEPEQRETLTYLFEERAGICQYDGGMSLGEAEREAYIELARAMDRSELRKTN